MQRQSTEYCVWNSKMSQSSLLLINKFPHFSHILVSVVMFIDFARVDFCAINNVVQISFDFEKVCTEPFCPMQCRSILIIIG